MLYYGIFFFFQIQGFESIRKIILNKDNHHHNIKIIKQLREHSQSKLDDQRNIFNRLAVILV